MVTNISLQSQANGKEVIACVNSSAHAETVATVAAGIAEALGLPLTLFHVVEAEVLPGQRPDPLEWDFQRHQSRRRLAQLAEKLPTARRDAALEFVEGNCVAEICRRAAGGALIVIGSRGRNTHAVPHGPNTQQLLERCPMPVLLVPSDAHIGQRGFRRLLVPIDGSSFAEMAVADATRIARATGAEILLVHVVPDGGLTLTGPLESTDIELRRRLERRNERVASDVLERLQRSLVDQGIRTEVLCASGEARATLLDIIKKRGCDLVVLSARGQGGRSGLDLPYGSTAAYILTHSPVPVLLVRRTARIAEDERPTLTIQRMAPPACAA